MEERHRNFQSKEEVSTIEPRSQELKNAMKTLTREDRDAIELDLNRVCEAVKTLADGTEFTD